MATAPALLSIDQYFRTNYSPDVDYLNGEVEERNVWEYEHSRLQWLIAVTIGSHEREWQIRGVAGQRIRVVQDRVRVCDIALLRASAPRGSVTETPPLVCIEILSPEDRLARAKLVLQDYLDMGVKNVWLIDPIRRAAFTFDSHGLHEADVSNLSVEGTLIELNLVELFASLD